MLSFLVFASQAVVPHAAKAAVGLVQCGNQENGKLDENGNLPGCTFKDIFSTTARIVNYLLSGAGVVAVGGVVYGGFMMVTSAGNESRSSGGKTAIKNALLGLVIVLLAVLIVQTLVRFLGLQGGDNVVTDPNSFIQGGE